MHYNKWIDYLKNKEKEEIEFLNFIYSNNLKNRNYEVEKIYESSILPKKYFEKIIKRNNIKNSKIVFENKGWVQEIALILQITPQKVTNWMRIEMPEFWKEKCFKRKGT